MELKDKTTMIDNKDNYTSDLEKRCDSLEKELDLANWEPTHETSIEFRFDIQRSDYDSEHDGYRSRCYINSKLTFSTFQYIDILAHTCHGTRCSESFIIEVINKILGFGFKLEDLNLPFIPSLITNEEFIELCVSETIVHSGTISALSHREVIEGFEIEYEKYTKYSKGRKLLHGIFTFFAYAWMVFAVMWIVLLIVLNIYSFLTDKIVDNAELEIIKIHGESMWSVKDENGNVYRISIPNGKNIFMQYEEPADE